MKTMRRGTSILLCLALLVAAISIIQLQASRRKEVQQ